MSNQAVTSEPKASRRAHVLLDGAYGAANLGDNAIAYCMSQFLIRNNVDVTISCNYPEYIRNTMGIESVPALNFRSLDIGILRDVRKYDAVVVGGGQQLQEFRIPNPFIGMFARVCQMARSAHNHRVPFVAWAVGMDWPLSRLGGFLARRYLGDRNATLIFRDGKSYERGKLLLHGRDCRITQSTDAAFMLSTLADQSLIANLGKYGPTNKKRLLLCASVLENYDGAVGRLVEICREAAAQGYEILGWHSEIRPNYDLRVREMADWDSIPGFRWLPPEPIDTNEVAALIRSSSIVIATRMHPAIIAVSQGVAAYGIATNGKMETVFEELKMPYSHVSKLSGLMFSAIASREFSPSFAMAAQFGQEAERGGRQVLAAIHRGWISASSLKRKCSA